MLFHTNTCASIYCSFLLMYGIERKKCNKACGVHFSHNSLMWSSTHVFHARPSTKSSTWGIPLECSTPLFLRACGVSMWSSFQPQLPDVELHTCVPRQTFHKVFHLGNSTRMLHSTVLESVWSTYVCSSTTNGAPRLYA